jgi:hypothetical protein
MNKRAIGLFFINLGAAVILAAVLDPLLGSGLILVSVGAALFAHD